jgi:hypothetical protein
LHISNTKERPYLSRCRTADDDEADVPVLAADFVPVNGGDVMVGGEFRPGTVKRKFDWKQA